MTPAWNYYYFMNKNDISMQNKSLCNFILTNMNDIYCHSYFNIMLLLLNYLGYFVSFCLFVPVKISNDTHLQASMYNPR